MCGFVYAWYKWDAKKGLSSAVRVDVRVNMTNSENTS